LQEDFSKLGDVRSCINVSGKFIASEIDKWAKAVRFANIKPE